MNQIETLASGLCFGEGPRWHNGTLWFSDMHDLAVKTVDLDGRVERKVEVPGQPSGLGWLPDGTLLVVSMTDRRVLRFEYDRLVVHAELGDIATFHCNDMVVDADGRAYVGNFGFDLHQAEKTGDWSIAAPATVGDGRSRRHGLGGGDRSVVPERHGHHAGRGDDDRRRVDGPKADCVRSRGRWHVEQPSRVGRARAIGCPTGSASTPTAPCGCRTPAGPSACASPRAVRSSR